VSGDVVTFKNIAQEDWTEINGLTYTVTYIGANSFSIDLDTTSYPVYVPGSNPSAKVQLGAQRIADYVSAAGLPARDVYKQFSFYRLGTGADFDVARVRMNPIYGTGVNTDADTTPDVAKYGYLRIENTNATTITRFDYSDVSGGDAYGGAILMVRHMNNKTTLQHAATNVSPHNGPNIHLLAGVDYTGTTASRHLFVYDSANHTWMEMFRYPAP
jgi:hypothetical protein